MTPGDFGLSDQHYRIRGHEPSEAMPDHCTAGCTPWEKKQSSVGPVNGQLQTLSITWAACPAYAATRIPVATILGQLGEGLTPADVLTDHPQLVLEDVLACLQYAAGAVKERTLPLHQP